MNEPEIQEALTLVRQHAYVVGQTPYLPSTNQQVEDLAVRATGSL